MIIFTKIWNFRDESEYITKLKIYETQGFIRYWDEMEYNIVNHTHIFICKQIKVNIQ